MECLLFALGVIIVVGAIVLAGAYHDYKDAEKYKIDATDREN